MSNMLTSSYQSRIQAAEPIFETQKDYLLRQGIPAENIQSFLQWLPTPVTPAASAGAPGQPTTASGIRTIRLKDGTEVDLNQANQRVAVRKPVTMPRGSSNTSTNLVVTPKM